MESNRRGLGEADGANLGRKAQEASGQARAGWPSCRIVHPMGHNIPSGVLSDFVEEFPVSYRVKWGRYPQSGTRRRCPAILPAKCIGASDVLAVPSGSSESSPPAPPRCAQRPSLDSCWFCCRGCGFAVVSRGGSLLFFVVPNCDQVTVR